MYKNKALDLSMYLFLIEFFSHHSNKKENITRHKTRIMFLQIYMYIT